MELNLKDIVGFFDIVKNMSWGSLPFWLSFGIPIFYLILKKCISADNANETKILARIGHILSIPKLENWVLVVSCIFLIIGSITIKVDQRISESVRNDGLRVKSFLVERNQYSVARNNIESALSISPFRMNDILRQYPDEFIVIYSKDLKNNTILLCDSLTQRKILIKSQVLLDVYLSNPVFGSNQVFSFDNLFQTNNFFTERVCWDLLVDSANKYHYNRLLNGSHGIIKK